MNLQLFLPSELETESKGLILQEVQESKGGYISIPDQILTKNLLTAAKTDDAFVREWRKKFDFHLAEFQLDINPKSEYLPEWVNIQCVLNDFDQPMQRPIAKSIFPATEFVDKDWKISGKFGVSATEGFKKLPALENVVTGEAKIDFTYAPKIARVDSGTAGSSFHWNFRKANNQNPIGGLDLKLVIMRLRSVEQMQLSFEVGVKFNRQNIPLIGDDTARAAGQSLIMFNPSPT